MYPCHTLRLTDVRTGAQRRFRAPGRLAFEPFNGAFSSTGGELAVPVAPPGSHGVRRLALVKLDQLAMKLIAGSRVPQGYVMAEWSRDDRHVFLAGGHRGTAVIVDYDRSRARVRRLRPTTARSTTWPRADRRAAPRRTRGGPTRARAPRARGAPGARR